MAGGVGGGLISDHVWNRTWLTKPLKELADTILTRVTVCLTSNAALVWLSFGLSKRWGRAVKESWSWVQMPPPNTGFQVYSRKQLKLHLHQKQENPGLITGKVAFAFPGASHCQVLFLRGEKRFCSLTKSTFFFFSLSLKILCGQREPATQSVFKGNLGNLRFPESGCS